MKQILLATSMCLVLYGCDPGQPSGQSSNATDFKASGAAEPLSQSEMNALTPEQQYLVANKALSMMQKGIPADEFFDLSQGVDNLVVSETNFINSLRNSLLNEMDDSQKNAINNEIYGVDPVTNLPDPDLALYSFREEDEARLLPYAQIMQYPISRDMFAAWIAHFLANTIMFSPAYEMESTDEVDIARIMSSLQLKVLEGASVRDIIRQHLPNVSRWRVSRSAENHALEAYELYLGLFDTEEDSRKGGIACQEWYLTDDDAGYQLSRTPFVNTEPQIILEDYVVTSCEELYDVVAGHPLLMPRVIEVIVNYFMNGRSTVDRAAVIESIASSGATTFEDIFKGILFSKEFLLNTEKPISMENNILSTYDRLRADRVASDFYNVNFFNNFAGFDFGGENDRMINVKRAGWASSEYKIGRTPNVPMDALSFASYHKGMRERIFSRPNAWNGGPRRLDFDSNNPLVNHVGLVYEAYDNDDADDDGDPSNDNDLDDRRLRPFLENMDINQYLDYLFLSTLARKATQDEKTDLVNFFETGGDDWLDPDADDPSIIKPDGDFRYDDIAEYTFDYISRLPEFYYHKAVSN